MIAVDVNVEGLCAVAGRAGRRGVDVFRAAEIPFSAAAVADGRVRSPVRLAIAMEKLHGTKGFRSSAVAMTVGGSAVLTRRLELPAARPREFGEMVENEMKQVVGDSAEFVYEYTLDREQPAGDGQPVRVCAYAMPREMVEGYLEVYRSLRLKPAALDIHANCIEKLLDGAEVNGVPVADKPVLMVQMEADGLEIHLFSKGRREFSRAVQLPAGELLAALRNAAADDGGAFAAEAAAARAGGSGVQPANRRLSGGRKRGLKAAQEPAEFGAAGLSLQSPAVLENPELSQAAGRYVAKLADEIGKMALFQLRRESAAPVAKAYLYGRLAVLGGLEKELSAASGVPAGVVRSVSKVRSKVEIAPFLNAVGALIRL